MGVFSIQNFPQYIGFESLFDQLDNLARSQKASHYPPYNVRKIDDRMYIIEMAVAGFSKNDIDITVNRDKLIIKSVKEDSVQKPYETYVHRGIAARSFEQVFQLESDMVVRGAALVDGILSVGIERIIPESELPRSIPIGDNSPLLTS